VDECHIGTINADDLDPILAIEQHSFQWPWSRSCFESELGCQNGFSFIVRSTEPNSDTQIIAYVFLRLIFDELHILKIAVKPGWREQGIASWILNMCFAMGAEQGADSVHLEVRPSNIAACELYQKLGFAVVGRRFNYYGDTNEDAVLMVKNLKEDK
jgi:ribosomal-protein-alanine N-acetyltransferase